MSGARSGALERRRIARRFSEVAPHYDEHAFLQKLVRDELLGRVREFALTPRRVLDLGAGTGHGARALKQCFDRAVVVAVDFAPGMLHAAGERLGWRERLWGGRLGSRFERLCADACALPFASDAFDLVFSNLMLQWCDDPDAALAEIRRVLVPGGLLLFSSFGPRTLQELRGAWAAVDERPHVNEFIDMHDLGGALARAGFSEPVLDVDVHELRYATSRDLMRDLQLIGARNAARERARGLTGRHAFAKMTAHYEQLRSDDALPATFEVVYGAAFAAERAVTGGAAPERGEVIVPVSAIGRRA